MKSLQATDRIEIYENLTIQTIINFKWNQYTKNFFEKQFLIFLVFVFLFIADTYLSIYMENSEIYIHEAGLSNPYVTCTLVAKLICLVILSYFAKYEIKSALADFGDYISEYWNFIDFMVIVMQLVSTVCFVSGVDFDVMRMIYCLMAIMVFIKVCFFLRIYDGFSFLVSMMQGVFLDLKYFIAFYMFVLILFTMLFSILDIKLGDAYGPIGMFGYFFMSFRTSTGDFEVDDYAEKESAIVYITWIIWLIAVLILNIVFMNFIIAVISESYEKIM
jgi:Ion transport protein